MKITIQTDQKRLSRQAVINWYETSCGYSPVCGEIDPNWKAVLEELLPKSNIKRDRNRGNGHNLFEADQLQAMLQQSPVLRISITVFVVQIFQSHIETTNRINVSG